jgi:chlorophyll synthase
VALFIRDIERRVSASEHPVAAKLPRSIEQVTQRVGRVPLKELVRESTDLIEALCIETALEVTGTTALPPPSAGSQPPVPVRQVAAFQYRRRQRRALGLICLKETPQKASIKIDAILHAYSDKPILTAMQRADISAEPRGVPSDRGHGALELLKPITWFPPMWAFMCGAVSSGVSLAEQPWLLPAGVLLVGPLVCGGSQIVNDWFDRHVDAINEPDRPIPSGRVPGRWGFYYAVTWSLLAWPSAAPRALGARRDAARPVPRLGLQRPAAAFQAKRLVRQPRRRPQLRGAGLGLRRRRAARRRPAAAAGALLALLYSLGAHGIMTLNDFKAIEGDLEIGVRSLPAQLRPDRAARLACVVMAVPQVLVIALLLYWGKPLHAAAVGLSLGCRLLAMRRLLTDPRASRPGTTAPA